VLLNCVLSLPTWASRGIESDCSLAGGIVMLENTQKWVHLVMDSSTTPISYFVDGVLATEQEYHKLKFVAVRRGINPDFYLINVSDANH